MLDLAATRVAHDSFHWLRVQRPLRKLLETFLTHQASDEEGMLRVSTALDEVHVSIHRVSIGCDVDYRKGLNKVDVPEQIIALGPDIAAGLSHLQGSLPNAQNRAPD